MPDVETSVTMNEQCRSLLARLGALDAQPEMAAAKRQIGVLALQDEKAHFLEQMQPSRTSWPKLGNVTVILRPRGKLPMIYDEADIESKRQNLELVYESSRLFQSLTPNAPGNVLDVRPGAVKVGTNVAYAELQQEGGMTTFEFGAEEYKRFKKNVSAVKKGFRRPPRRKDGKRWSWAKHGKVSPWNVFYFKLLGALRKMRGRSFRVPARPFLIAPKPEWTAKYLKVLSAAIKRITG